MSVWIAQVECPEKHVILSAVTSDARDLLTGRIEKYVRSSVDSAFDKGLIGWHCGRCGAPRKGWSVKVRRTPWATIEEAIPHLAQSEAAEKAQALVSQAKPTGPKGKS